VLPKDEIFQIYKHQFHLSNDQSGSVEALNKFQLKNMNYLNCKR